MLKSIPRFLIETAKGLRKVALYQESRFLYEVNRRIYFSQYSHCLQGERKIIVSLTTHKERIEYVHYALDSLYVQTLRPSEVRLYVAKGEYKIFPDILKKFQPWLKIIQTDDIGSYKKFIPALMEAREDEIIVSLDDDFVYPPHLLSCLYRHFLKHQDALIGYCGFKNDKPYFEGIAGGMGILWNPKIFNPRAMPYFFKKELFFDAIGRNYDDGWISLSCLENKIPIQCVYDQYFETFKEFIELPSGKLHAISSSGKGENHISIQEKLKLRERTRKIILENIQSVK